MNKRNVSPFPNLDPVAGAVAMPAPTVSTVSERAARLVAVLPGLAADRIVELETVAEVAGDFLEIVMADYDPPERPGFAGEPGAKLRAALSAAGYLD